MAEAADGQAAAASARVFSLEEVSKHSKETDCWLVIHGKVYDVTKFMDDHPGGGDVLLSSTGRDASDDFEDIGHSGDARKMLEEYLIGEVDPATLPAQPAAEEARQRVAAHRKQEGGGGALMLVLQILVPLAILALAIAVRFITAPQEPKLAS